MNKEEILEKSRKENKGKDISELQAIAQGSRMAVLVCGLIGLALMLFELYLGDTVHQKSILGLFFSMIGTIRIVKYMKLRKTFELVMGIVYLLIAAMYIVLYVVSLVN